MGEVLIFLVKIAAIGIVSLFAAFFIILGLNKKLFWQEIYELCNFKEKK